MIGGLAFSKSKDRMIKCLANLLTFCLPNSELEHIKVVMTGRAVLIILQQRLNPVRGELVEP